MAKYGIYKNEWSSADYAPFTTITANRVGMVDGAYAFYRWDQDFLKDSLEAIYPMSAFYVVRLESL